jgi:signal transduction histidine kinase
MSEKPTYEELQQGVKELEKEAAKCRQIEETLRDGQEKIARLKKMESLGLLAGGVAHDLNNVLSGIVSYPELLLLELPENSKLRKPIETMQNSGHRAVAIVQDLLTVARGVATVREPLNLNDMVRDYLRFIRIKRPSSPAASLRQMM